MKKILIVGGGRNQIPLILASRLEGFFTVVVDYAGERCPAYSMADRFYNVSTQDEDGIMEVARREGIDGIISNSEPSMLIVNSIAERLGLVGNPVEGIEVLVSKNRFRELQQQVGVVCPDFFVADSLSVLLSRLPELSYPLVVKPCDSSGSRGFKKIDSYDERMIEEAFTDCKKYSRSGMVVVEEYVEMPSLTTVEGDLFLHNGEILWDGLFSTTRSSRAPMVPMTYTAPLFLEQDRRCQITDTLSRLLDAAGVRFGEYNVEGYFTSTGDFFVLEINVRQGGNEIPMFIKDATDIDMNRLLVTTAVGDTSYWDYLKGSRRVCQYAMKHLVFSYAEGSYGGLQIDDSVRKYITRTVEWLKPGDHVDRCVNATNVVAIVDLRFPAYQEQSQVYERMDELINVIIN